MRTTKDSTQAQSYSLDEQLAQEAFEHYVGAPESVIRKLCEENSLDFHEEFEIPYNNYMTNLLQSRDWRN